MSKLNTSFFKIAMQRLSLFRKTRNSRALLETIAQVSGVPILTLLYVERRMTQEGSLVPLKDMLESDGATRCDFFRYKIGLIQKISPQKSRKEALANRFELKITTERGVIDIQINILAKRKLLEFENERQEAFIEINYKITSKNIQRRFRQELHLSGIAPSTTFPLYHTEKLHGQHAA